MEAMWSTNRRNTNIKEDVDIMDWKEVVFVYSRQDYNIILWYVYETSIKITQLIECT